MEKPARSDGSHGVTPEMEQRLRLAEAAVQAHRPDVALQTYQALLDAHPECDFPAVHAKLGFVLLGLRRYAEAVPHFAQALEKHSDDVPVRVGLAYALQRQSNWSAAEDHYRRALALQPEHAQAMLGMGTCLRQRGHLEDACAWFERALQMDPGCMDAYHLLSTLRRFAENDPMLAQCEAQQARVAALPPIKQARYWFALGKMREDAGRFDDAFVAYAAGNRVRAGLFVLDESDADAWLERTRAAFDATLLAAHPRRSSADGRVPVFVIGMPRSGTSLIEQILASHPNVHGAGEIADLRDVLVGKAGEPQCWPEQATGLPREVLRELGDAYVERVFRRAPQATHVVNKTTLNYRHVGLIRMLLPQARIIHAVRDPMDSCFSCFSHLFNGDNLPYSYDLQTLGRYYVRYAKLMQHWRTVVPDAVLDVRYEDLVRDTEGQVRRMLDYLGLEWNAACLDFHRNRRLVETASRAQVTQPIYRSSVARWQHFEKHLQPLLELVAPWR
ncbi:MAG: sulfotransferase [Pseudomonadota bacterium]